MRMQKRRTRRPNQTTRRRSPTGRLVNTVVANPRDLVADQVLVGAGDPPGSAPCAARRTAGSRGSAGPACRPDPQSPQWRREGGALRRHAQPPGHGPRARPWRRRRCPGRVRCGAGTCGRRGGGQRPGVRQHRVAGAVRGNYPLPAVPRRQAGHHPQRAAPSARAGEPGRSTCVSPARRGSGTPARTSSTSRTTPTAARRPPSPAARASTVVGSGWSRWSSRTPLRLRRSARRSRPAGRNGFRVSSPGRRRPGNP